MTDFSIVSLFINLILHLIDLARTNPKNLEDMDLQNTRLLKKPQRQSKT